MSQLDKASSEHNRLYWQCRRGMLELDEILMRYLERGYPQADKEQQQVFVELLRLEDPLLQRWLILGEMPDSRYSDIVRRIRAREG